MSKNFRQHKIHSAGQTKRYIKLAGFLVGTLMLLFLAGCGGSAATAFRSDSSSIPHSSSAQVTPQSIDFGVVATGGQSAKSVTVTNTGRANLTISGAVVTGTGFTLSGLSLPLTLAANQKASFEITFAPTNATNAAGSLSIVTTASADPMNVSLSGTGVVQQVSSFPSQVSFGEVEVGSSSRQPLKINNAGTTSLTLTNVAATGPGFRVDGFQLPLTLGAGESTNISVHFSPTATSSAAGLVTITGNNNTPLATISVSGTGAVHSLTVSPMSVNFGNVELGNSSTQVINVTNTGTAGTTINQIAATGAGFAVAAASTPAHLKAGQSMTFDATFAPTTSGSVTGNVSILSNASDAPTTVTLSGNGTTLQLSASPGSINFGDVAVGKSNTQTVTLSNTGTGSITISQVMASGTGFSVKGVSLPLTLAAGKQSSFTADFAPTNTGATSGSISIVSNASSSPARVALSGNGVTLQLSASPTNINFGDVVPGSKSSETVILTNTGTSPLTISQVTTSGTGFSVSGLSLPLTLNSGLQASLTATFSPTATGSASGGVSIVSNASNSPSSVALSGNGVTLQLSASPASISFGDVVIRSTASQTIVLSNTGTASVTIDQANVSGTGFKTSELTLPLTIQSGQTAYFGITFSPTVTGSATGTVSLDSNATSSPTTLSLSGNGVNGHSITLAWNPDTGGEDVGYNIYRATASGGPFTKLNSSLIVGTTYTDPTVQAGQTYYFVATGVDADNGESGYSNEVSTTIPSP